MVKEAKFFRKQAAKAERMARTVADAEISERYLNQAFRSKLAYFSDITIPRPRWGGDKHECGRNRFPKQQALPHRSSAKIPAAAAFAENFVTGCSHCNGILEFDEASLGMLHGGLD